MDKSKGNAAIGIIIVLVIIAGISGGYFVYKNQNEDAAGLTTYKSDLFGLSVKYSPDIWLTRLESGTVSGLYSKERILAEPEFKLTPELREGSGNAKYYFGWSYVLKAFYSNYDAWYELNCPPASSRASYELKEKVEKVSILISKTQAQGCKRMTYSQNSTTHYDIIRKNLYLIHPISGVAVELKGVSNDVDQSKADMIFKQFDDVFTTITFYSPSNEVLKQLQNPKPQIPTLAPDQQDLIQIKQRDARKLAEIQNIQIGLAQYHKEANDFPQNISSLIPKYLSVPSDAYGPLSLYNYFRCDKDTYHLAVSLENKANVLLKQDIDKKLCASDPINFSDDQKCMSADTGNFCYDVGLFR